MSSIPKSERVWVRYFDSNHNETHVITSNEVRTLYYLYAKTENGWKKVARSKTPQAFEEVMKA